MAEIATEVLHNVGNAINSVNVTAELIGEKVRQSRVDGLAKAVTLLRENQPNLATFMQSDPRGPKLIDYLVKLSDAASQERQQLMSDVQNLSREMGHIREIIDTQQAYAGGPSFRQEEDLAAVIDDVLRMQAGILSSAKVKVQREYGPLPGVPMSKVKLMQVLMNLVKNAAESIAQLGAPDRRIVIRARSEGDFLKLEVIDNGAGIEPETLKRLFNHGFTTKAKGHGFGLHYCANAIAEMGGKIEARSDGPGKGAAFIIRLPRSAKGVAV
jgi:two-component system NtrC family sensor kinase